ncbi:MAG: hypothetical protein QXE79_01535 [Candidatus Bathyarchaeia archaeon]
MARQPDPAVEELDRRIVALRDKGLSYRDIAEQLGVPISRCRLAARRDHYRKYLREYLKEYRRRHPEFYERLKRMVTERCRLRLRTDPEFRSKRNRYAREYRSTIFGDKELENPSDILNAFRHIGEVLSTRTMVKRLGNPTYHHFYSRLKAAVRQGLVERVSWGLYKARALGKEADSQPISMS